MRPDNPFTGAYLDHHPEEAARTLEGLAAERAAAFLAAIAPPRAAGALSSMVAPAATAVLLALPPRTARVILHEVDAAVAERWLRRIPGPEAEALLDAVDAATARRLRRRLRRPVGMVGGIAETAPLWLPDDVAVAEAARRLRAGSESGCEVYVVDREHRPVGWLPLGRLFAAAADTPVRALLEGDLTTFDVHTPLPAAAAHRVWDRVRSAPVVDADGRVVGLVRYGDLQAAVRGGEEHGFASGGDAGLAVADLVWLGLGAVLTTALGGDDGAGEGG